MLSILKSKIIKLFASSCIMASGVFVSEGSSSLDNINTRKSQAIQIVQNLLKTDKPLTAELLYGGLSEASLIKVMHDNEAYVVRFLGTQHFGTCTKNEHEIECQQIASDTGYGPHVYGSNEQSSFVVIQYLQAEPFPEPKNLLSSYVTLVKKIHSGAAFPVTFRYFDHIDEDIKALEAKKQNIVDLAKIKIIIDKIRQAVSHFPLLAPCHRDLHPGNVIYSQEHFFAIDYTLSGQDDPYIDLAAFIFQLHEFFPDKNELLLGEYLGRQPTDKELAKLSLMRLAVLIFHGVSFPRNIPEEFLQVRVAQDSPPKGYLQILQDFGKGIVDLGDPLRQVEFVRAMFAEVIKYYDSDQFSKDLKLLQMGREFVHSK